MRPMPTGNGAELGEGGVFSYSCDHAPNDETSDAGANPHAESACLISLVDVRERGTLGSGIKDDLRYPCMVLGMLEHMTHCDDSAELV